MQITYNNQTIDFTAPSNDHFVISLSGGADSAALFYLACKHYPGKLFIPFTGRDENAPLDAEAAQEITSFMQTTFPNRSIKKCAVFNFNDIDYKYTKHKSVKRILRQKYPTMNMRQVSKIVQLHNMSTMLRKHYPKSKELDAISANPSVEDMETNSFGRFGEIRRLHSNEKSTVGENRWQPFINVNKRFIADVYKQNKLLDTLFPITRSCTGGPEETNNFTKECHQCFWCFERKWAFNLDWNNND